ncbi:MAG: isoaspartyl peptidase/L-asparaginase [Deltaproteobacteria bacterium]|nr:isoaspartyl peptidase/L-asparaginase [Deltaproteobacteria bacterium]
MTTGLAAIIVHGGAGDIAETRAPLHVDGCLRAARVGHAVLHAGGPALAAVEDAVRALEDDPLFNAGRGACLNHEGEIELDACIMDGTLRAGAVGALPPFANPIAIARCVLEDGEHVLYAGEGAARFATLHGFRRLATGDLRTDAAVERWKAVLAKKSEPNWAGGTVGAVAIDSSGAVAAATSTGGIACKRAGRVGDSSIIGAGNLADDEAGAASATGHGEPIMRVCLTRFALTRVSAGRAAQEAAEDALAELARRTGARAGIILVDRAGRVGHATTTKTMSWAAITPDGEGAGV